MAALERNAESLGLLRSSLPPLVMIIDNPYLLAKGCMGTTVFRRR